MTIDDAERQRIIEAIRTYMARERISREEFAQRCQARQVHHRQAGDGPVLGTHDFADRVCRNIKLREAGPAPRRHRPSSAATLARRPHISSGTMCSLVPSFQEEGVIQAFHMEIVWGPGENVLVLQEPPRSDEISPRPARFIYPAAPTTSSWCPTRTAGCRPRAVPDQCAEAYAGHDADHGARVRQHLFAGRGSGHHEQARKVEASMVGRIASRTALYTAYQAELQAVEAEGFGRWVRP